MAVQTKKEGFNFDRFFTLFKGSDNAPKIEVKPENSKEQALEKQAQVFLGSDMIDLFVKMQANGYSPSEEQTEVFEKKLQEKIALNDTGKLLWLEDLIKDGLVLSPKIYTTLLMNHNFQNRNWEHLTDYNFFRNPHSSGYDQRELDMKAPEPTVQPLLIAQIRELSQKPEYSQSFFDAWHHLLTNMRPHCEQFLNRLGDNSHALLNRSFGEVTGALNLRGILLAHLSMAEYIDLSQEIVQIGSKDIFVGTSRMMGTPQAVKGMDTINGSWGANILPYHHAMQKEFKTIYANDIEGILTETKSVFMENYLAAQTIKESQNRAKDYSLAKLPQAEQELLDIIKDKYNALLPHYRNMNEEDKHNLNHLVVDKLPVIINRYLSMNEEYRNTMTNSQGKNAQELLHESLSNIEQHLEHIIVNLNELNLKELSVSARYTGQKNKF